MTSDMLRFLLKYKELSKLGFWQTWFVKLSKLIFWPILIVLLFMASYTLWVTPQHFGKWKTLLGYISVVSFINIAFVFVELKIFKIFRIDSAAMKWSLFGGFSALFPQILFDLAEILTRGSLPKRRAQCLKNPSKFWILAQMQCT